MVFHYRIVYLIAVLLLVPILNACGGKSHTDLANLSQRSSSGFIINASAPPGQTVADAAAYTLEIVEQAGTIWADVAVEAAQPITAAYCELSYNVSQYTPVAVEFTDELAGADTQPDSLVSLDVQSQAGTVYLGQVITAAATTGSFKGTARLARVQFHREPFAARQPSAPPRTEASATSLDWDVENKVLSWGYCCQGDYNQDGLVSVHDLTPLGVHYLEEGPFDEHSALAVIDGNGDGLITVNDITPIGQNFGARVEGYEVVATEDPAEVPARQVSEIFELGFIPLESAQGDKIQERLWFEQAYPELDPELKIWVVPVGDGEAGMPSWPQQPGLAMWSNHNVSSFAGCPGGLANDITIVGAMPAVAYADHYNDKLCYQRATLVDGSTWAPEVVVATNAACSFVSLNVVNGNPAIAYADLTAGQLRFVRATNPQGTDWDTPVVIDDESAMTSGTPLYYPKLQVINGYPAIGYLDYYAREIRYRAALDTTGTNWDAIIKVAAFATPNTPEDTGCSFAVIGGLPAVAFSDSQGTAVKYTQATTAAGSAWNSPAIVDGSTAVGVFMSLFEVDGLPAVAYRAGTAVRYSIAGNTSGTSWTTPVLAVADVGSGQHLRPSLHVNRGKPAVAYYHQHPQTNRGWLGYATALDARGLAWASDLRVDDGTPDIDTGFCPQLINVGINPAISYCNVSAGELWFATSIDVFNQLPQAELAAAPIECKAGQEIEFDASGSTDPDGEIVLYEWDWDDDNVYDETSGTNAVVRHAYAEVGVYTPHVRVFDNAGGWERGWVTVAVQENVRPSAQLVITPDRGTAPFTVNFDASSSFDDDGTIVMYEWDWDGDGVFEHETGNSPYWSWTYEHEGELFPAVKVIDNDGAFDIETVLCSGNTGPIAIAQATPNAGTAPFDVKLTSSGSYDPDGTITQVWWDIHDDGVAEYHGYNLNTWTTKMVWNGAVKIRLRVMDNEGAYGSTLISVNTIKGWHLSQVDEAGDVGSYNSLAQINGRPAIAYYDYTNRYLKYVRASDAKGYSWPTPMSIGVIADASTPVCYGISLAWINGSYPGIAFSGEKSANWQEGYVLATNSNGTSWGSFISLSQGSCSQPSLAVVASNPAIACVNADTYFYRATNATGSAWNAQQTVETSTPPYGCQLAVVNGNPAIVYCHRTPYPGMDEQVTYVRAGDAVGDSWGTPVRLDTANSMVDDISLCVINGNPAVAYIANDDTTAWGVHYIRANNANGTSWPAGSKVIDNKNRGSCALTEISGRPAVAYVAGCSGSQLMFVRASDTTGGTWPTPMLVDAHICGDCDMIELGGKPGISYYTTMTIGGAATLRYAVWE